MASILDQAGLPRRALERRVSPNPQPPSGDPMKVIDSILTQSAAIASVRRDIHAHPELCFEEVRTADVVAAKLTEWGIADRPGPGHHRCRRHREERHVDAGHRPARRHGRLADAGVQHLRPRQPERRKDACLRPRRPYRDAARGSTASGEEPQFRRHGLPDLPAGRRRRRWRARDDQGRTVRANSPWRRCSACTTGRATRSASLPSAPGR